MLTKIEQNELVIEIANLLYNGKPVEECIELIAKLDDETIENYSFLQVLNNSVYPERVYDIAVDELVDHVDEYHDIPLYLIIKEEYDECNYEL